MRLDGWERFPLRNQDDRQTLVCLVRWTYNLWGTATFRNHWPERWEAVRCDRVYDRFLSPGAGHYVGLDGICLA